MLKKLVAIVFSAALIGVLSTSYLITHQRPEYAITLVLELWTPLAKHVDSDAFQEVEVLSQDNDVTKLKCTLYPLRSASKGQTSNSPEEITDGLQPHAAGNLPDEVRSAIRKEINRQNIRKEKATEELYVQDIVSWALRRAKQDPTEFGIWFATFVHGRAKVDEDLQKWFKLYRYKQATSDRDAFEHELYGASMYQLKWRGACTSTATYLCTIFRAVGYPCRIVGFVPALNAVRQSEVDQALRGIKHPIIRQAIASAAADLKTAGLVDHFFNEVYVGNHWLRVNGWRVGASTYDNNLGLMVHIDTFADISERPMSRTWARCLLGNYSPQFTSVNPYRLVSISDNYSRSIENTQ